MIESDSPIQRLHSINSGIVIASFFIGDAGPAIRVEGWGLPLTAVKKPLINGPCEAP